jgi:hypothetical protein
VDRDAGPEAISIAIPGLAPSAKVTFRHLVEFCDRATYDRFTEMLVGLVRAAHPDAFDSDVAP